MFLQHASLCATRKLRCIHNQLIMNQTTTVCYKTQHRSLPSEPLPSTDNNLSYAAKLGNITLVTILMCLLQENCTVPINGI